MLNDREDIVRRMVFIPTWRAVLKIKLVNLPVFKGPSQRKVLPSIQALMICELDDPTLGSSLGRIELICGAIDIEEDFLHHVLRLFPVADNLRSDAED